MMNFVKSIVNRANSLFTPVPIISTRNRLINIQLPFTQRVANYLYQFAPIKGGKWDKNNAIAILTLVVGIGSFSYYVFRRRAAAHPQPIPPGRNSLHVHLPASSGTKIPTKPFPTPPQAVVAPVEENSEAALKRKSSDEINSILKEEGIDPAVVKKGAPTPLHFACKSGKPQLVTKLLNAALSEKWIREDDKYPSRSALQFLVDGRTLFKEQFSHLFEQLLDKYKAFSAKHDLSTIDFDGANLLNLVARMGFHKPIKTLIEDFKVSLAVANGKEPTGFLAHTLLKKCSSPQEAEATMILLFRMSEQKQIRPHVEKYIKDYISAGLNNLIKFLIDENILTSEKCMSLNKEWDKFKEKLPNETDEAHRLRQQNIRPIRALLQKQHATHLKNGLTNGVNGH